MSISYNKFGEVLRQLRKEGNLTQEKLSKIINADRSSVANYERGERLPPIESLVMIAQYFNVSLDYLILGRTHNVEDEQDVNDEVKSGLMAENTSLMEAHLRLQEVITEKDDEIKLLKSHISSMEKYIGYLKKNLKEEDDDSL